MIYQLLNRQLGFIARSFLRFLEKFVSRTMGCFFGCFRVRGDTSRPQFVSAASTRSKSTERVVSRNRLSSLFLDEEKGGSRFGECENVGFESPQIRRGLRDEANFLKACGTIPETPVEIRKASEKLKHSPSFEGNSEQPKFHTWLPNTSIKKLLSERQTGQPSSTIKLYEERELSFSEQMLSSISNAGTCGRISNCAAEGNEETSMDAPQVKTQTSQTDNVKTSISPWPPATNIHGKTKSVRFECDDASPSIGSSHEDASQGSKNSVSPGKQSVTKPYPHPTPLKLSDEMQTPGTVYPTNVEAIENGKTRIRSQYVYSVLNPVEDASQWKVLKDEQIGSKEMLGDLRDSFEQLVIATPEPEVGVKKETSISGKGLNVEASLSSWLKPQPNTHNENNQNLWAASSNVPQFCRTGDRPIIGMVAAHWNENERSHISHKWWDGNGIPNSTTKYKEDQKVSWHATPFEERLEKALSEESLITQRKHAYKTPLVFDEADEADTAISLLQPSAHSKSVVSV
ncbi:hypothetical protein SLE2022_211680 [Rubroshorea leprosula]